MSSYVYTRTQLFQTLAESCHAHDASRLYRTEGFNTGRIVEKTRKAVRHAFGYAAVLALAFRRERAFIAASLFFHDSETPEHIVAKRGQTVVPCRAVERSYGFMILDRKSVV